jgi:endoribonuclease LACTB2
VISTPGHAPGHVSLCDRETRAFFAGDLISGNGTIAVVPPRGSMSEYVASLYRAQQHGIGIVYPGHGPVIPDGPAILQSYLARRISREDGIIELIDNGISTLDDLTDEIYGDVQPRLRGLAKGTLLAHVLKLVEEERVTCSTEDVEFATLYLSPYPARHSTGN